MGTDAPVPCTTGNIVGSLLRTPMEKNDGIKNKATKMPCEASRGSSVLALSAGSASSDTKGALS